MHTYAASFGDDLASDLMLANTEEGDLCLDPFSGAATTLIQARLLGRAAVGIDIDPIAALIGRVSTTPCSDDELRELYDSVSKRLDQIVRIMSDMIVSNCECEAGCRISIDGLSASIPQNEKLQFWFAPVQRLVLAMLVAISRSHDNPNHSDIIDLAISSAIIHKWPATLSQARDIDHSRPHRVLRDDLSVDSQIRIFYRALGSVLRTLRKLNELTVDYNVHMRVIEGDSAEVLTELEPASVHYVITSPPYFNAIDYPRAHKFSQWWLWPQRDQLTRHMYIGLRTGMMSEHLVRLISNLGPENVRSLALLEEISKPTYVALCQYIDDLNSIVNGVARVLKPGRNLSLILANNTIKGMEVPVVDITAELLRQNRFHSVSVEKRSIVHNRRRYPFGIRGFKGLMESEYIVNARSAT